MRYRERSSSAYDVLVVIIPVVTNDGPYGPNNEVTKQ